MTLLGFIAALVLSFVPMWFYAYIVYWLDRFEREPIRLLIGVFLWGAFVSPPSARHLSKWCLAWGCSPSQAPSPLPKSWATTSSCSSSKNRSKASPFSSSPCSFAPNLILYSTALYMRVSSCRALP